MSLDKALQALKFDVRLQEYSMKQGRYTKQDLEQFIQTLPDCSSNAESVDLENQEDDSDSH